MSMSFIVAMGFTSGMVVGMILAGSAAAITLAKSKRDRYRDIPESVLSEIRQQRIHGL